MMMMMMIIIIPYHDDVFVAEIMDLWWFITTILTYSDHFNGDLMIYLTSASAWWFVDPILAWLPNLKRCVQWLKNVPKSRFVFIGYPAWVVFILTFYIILYLKLAITHYLLERGWSAQNYSSVAGISIICPSYIMLSCLSRKISRLLAMYAIVFSGWSTWENSASDTSKTWYYVRN